MDSLAILDEFLIASARGSSTGNCLPILDQSQDVSLLEKIIITGIQQINRIHKEMGNIFLFKIEPK